MEAEIGNFNYSSPLLMKMKKEEEIIIISFPSSSSFIRNVWEETKMIWYIASPVILTGLSQFSLAIVTMMFSGHIGTTEFAAVGFQIFAIAGIGFGIMFGMGSALEILCGQAYGAGRLSMLGIYMQRSWVILLTTALPLTVFNVFVGPILKLIGLPPDVSDMTGKFSIWMIPELYAYALNFPIQKFLQAQSKVIAMAWISFGVLLVHVFLNWLFIVKLDTGLVGAAITLNFSWWLLVIGQLVYIVSGSCKDSWSGFSWLAFSDLSGYVKLSLGSGVILSLEYWSTMGLVLLAGFLKNTKEAVGLASIILSLEGLFFNVPLGFLKAISVRVSNEFRAGRPEAAKFSAWVTLSNVLIIQITFGILVYITRNEFPILFTDDMEVRTRVGQLAIYIYLSIVISCIQPVLAGTAIGAGWQAVITYVNVGSYYFAGLPGAFLLRYKFHSGVEGLWVGVVSGFLLQIFITMIVILRIQWNKEVMLPEEVVPASGGSVDYSSIEQN